MTTRATRSSRSSRAGSLAAALVAGLLAGLAAGSPAVGEGLRRRVVDPPRAARIHAEARWRQIVQTFDVAGDRPDPLYVAADAASSLKREVREAGWSSPRIPELVAVLEASANPDGGYGLARPWDAYQDGTVNPETTSYAATTAGHVGPILLDGYLAGAVPEAVIDRAVDSILDLPRVPGDACIPYSNSPYDLGKPCVWNVHFGAAAWVRRASTATSHRREEALTLVTTATSVLDTLSPDPETGYLPYASGGVKPQDIGHQLWTATSIDYLRGNRDALTAMVSRPYWRVQARRFRDYNVAAALGGIALSDCRYAVDPLVLTYAGMTTGGNPYVFKSMAAQAREVLATCFPAEGSAAAQSVTPARPLVPVVPGMG